MNINTSKSHCIRFGKHCTMFANIITSSGLKREPNSTGPGFFAGGVFSRGSFRGGSFRESVSLFAVGVFSLVGLFADGRFRGLSPNIAGSKECVASVYFSCETRVTAASGAEMCGGLRVLTPPNHRSLGDSRCPCSKPCLIYDSIAH